jgi:hypothetical protein
MMHGARLACTSSAALFTLLDRYDVHRDARLR